jgi:hypothetical protein
METVGFPHAKKYIVRLTAEEREHLNETVKKLKGSGQKVRRAQILLKADADGSGWMDKRIAEAFFCMDEQSVQLIKETRQPIEATKKNPRRVDYEYERAGTASIFMFAERLSGWRQTTARPQRTKSDWAVEVAELLEGRYADRKKVTLVCDNLNTHTKGAFYEAFEPERARSLVRRIGDIRNA